MKNSKITDDSVSLVGRPRFEDDLQKRRNISLSDRLADKATKIGKGNLSNGIRIVIESHNLDDD